MTRGYSTLAAALLAAWCALGFSDTARGLRRWPAGSADSGVVGVPLAGAGDVRAIRRLLPPGGSPGTWIVLYPQRADSLTVAYIQFQLAHLQYPQRVKVAREPHGPTAGVAGIVTAPGARPPRSARPVAAWAGFTVFAAPNP